MAQNGSKWLKMVKYGLILLTIVKYGSNWSAVGATASFSDDPCHFKTFQTFCSLIHTLTGYELDCA